MKIDHIGYAVKKMDQALESFRKLGFSFGQIIDDTDRNIRIVFGEKESYRIELVCPLNKDKESPVDTYLSNVGATPYHICYQSENLDTKIEELQKNGFKVIIPPAEAVAFGRKKVVFMMTVGMGLLEIVEK